MKEVLLTITGVVFLLGYGYYCVRYTAKAAESYSYEGKRRMSERHIRIMG